MLVLRYKNNKITSRAELVYSSDEALNQAREKAIAAWKETFKNCGSDDGIRYSNVDFAHSDGPYLDLYAKEEGYSPTFLKEEWQITSIQSSIKDAIHDMTRAVGCYKASHKEIPYTEFGCLFKTLFNSRSPRELGLELVKLLDEVAKTA